MMRLCVLAGFLLASSAWAQNSIVALDVAENDEEVIVEIGLSQPLASEPKGFTLDQPARLVFDLPGTVNASGRKLKKSSGKRLRTARLIQSDRRTRLVLELDHLLDYEMASDASSLRITLREPKMEEPEVLRFDISGYTLDGATLLGKEEIDAVVAPYVGKDKDFSDVQHALEAVEEAYASRGYTAVRVLLPEQELEKGAIRFRVVESRFGSIAVKDNKFVDEANAMRALPSLRSGNMPRTRQIARELRLANENPARQMNVVLKAGRSDGEVDATVSVTDSKPEMWALTLDNTGTPETGRTRLGLSYRHANLHGLDHVASVQAQISPEQIDRVRIVGAGYKIPLYERGDSVEFFGGYSNVNSVVGGLSNFQGGGLLLSARYNHPLEKFGEFEPRVSFGLDWRDFKRIEQTNPPVTTLYNEIVVMPVSVAYAVQGKFPRSEVNFNASLAANLPGMDNGKAADFAAYDQVSFTRPDPNYRVLRYGASYSALVGPEWQFRAVLNGQFSDNVLIQGEQMRLGGADAVRGFTEGSEGGERGNRLNLEVYTPDFSLGEARARGLVFLDAGEVETAAGVNTSIASAGLGLRASIGQRFSLRMDAARITDAGNDPQQRIGNWHSHVGLTATF